MQKTRRLPVTWRTCLDVANSHRPIVGTGFGRRQRARVGKSRQVTSPPQPGPGTSLLDGRRGSVAISSNPATSQILWEPSDMPAARNLPSAEKAAQQIEADNPSADRRGINAGLGKGGQSAAAYRLRPKATSRPASIIRSLTHIVTCPAPLEEMLQGVPAVRFFPAVEQLPRDTRPGPNRCAGNAGCPTRTRIGRQTATNTT